MFGGRRVLTCLSQTFFVWQAEVFTDGFAENDNNDVLTQV